MRYEINKLPEDGKKITVADTAEFAMQEMIDSRFPQKESASAIKIAFVLECTMKRNVGQLRTA